jgi:hypothetical protein
MDTPNGDPSKVAPSSLSVFIRASLSKWLVNRRG